MLFHDPELCIVLDKSQMTPQVYATPWLVTLFGRHTPMSALFALWDTFICFSSSEEMLPLFTVLAFVHSHRELLLRCSEEQVPESLSQLVLETEEDVAHICEKAHELIHQTPSSLKAALRLGCFCRETTAAARSDMLRVREAMPCMTTACEDVLPSLLGTCTETRGRPCRFELFDCRSRAEFASKHVEGSHHLDPAAHRRALSVTSRGGLVALVRTFSDVPSEDTHLCFFAGASELAQEDDDLGGELFALEYAVLFIQRGFRHVSVLVGGFPALAAALEHDGVYASHGIYPVAMARPPMSHRDAPEPEHRPDSHQAHEALHALQHRTAQLGSTIRAVNVQTCSRLVRCVRAQATALEKSAATLETVAQRLQETAARFDALNGKLQNGNADAGATLGVSMNAFMG